jgi:hypothetical protein
MSHSHIQQTEETMATTGEAAPLDSLELDVDEENRKRVIEMLRPHYMLWDGRLGHIKNVVHCIPTTGPQTRQAPYRCGLKTRDAVQAEITRMEKIGVVEPSTDCHRDKNRVVTEGGNRVSG